MVGRDAVFLDAYEMIEIPDREYKAEHNLFDHLLELFDRGLIGISHNLTKF